MGEKSGNQDDWMFEIVNNPRNSIDVDKFDYLQRDAKKLGVYHCSFN